MVNNHTALEATERAQLIIDTSPILRDGHLDMSLTNSECKPSEVTAWWRMMGYLKKEKNILPLQVSLDIFSTMLKLKPESKPLVGMNAELIRFLPIFRSWIVSLL